MKIDILQRVKQMAWDAVLPHVHLDNHRHLSSFVGSDETLLTDHLPQGFPQSSAV